MEKEEIRCIISGRVQMVMFRDFVAHKAYRLALVGFVQNLDNGTVEIIAQGFRENLEKFLEYVHKGPFLAKVSRVDAEWRSPTKSFDSFTLIR